jgi:hypothetical protein
MEGVLDSLRQQTQQPDAVYVSIIQGAPLPDFLVAAGDVTVVRHAEVGSVNGVAYDLGPVHKLLDCAMHGMKEAFCVGVFVCGCVCVGVCVCVFCAFFGGGFCLFRHILGLLSRYISV